MITTVLEIAGIVVGAIIVLWLIGVAICFVAMKIMTSIF